MFKYARISNRGISRMNRVDEKVAVVTGGTQGLGKAIAMNLAKMGAKGVIAL